MQHAARRMLHAVLGVLQWLALTPIFDFPCVITVWGVGACAHTVHRQNAAKSNTMFLYDLLIKIHTSDTIHTHQHMYGPDIPAMDGPQAPPSSLHLLLSPDIHMSS